MRSLELPCDFIYHDGMEASAVTAAQIRAARAALGWTLAELAEMTGLTRKTLASIETDGGPSYDSTRRRTVESLMGGGVEFTMSDGRPCVLLPPA